MKLGMYQSNDPICKGKYYHVLALARHSETLEEMVVYRALYGEYGIWVRPLSIFQENVVEDGKEVPRFQFIREIDVFPPIVHQK